MKITAIILTVFLAIGLLGFGSQKYKVEFDAYGFSSKKTHYAEGATVKVTYDMIATDTDYEFYLDCDDTKLNIDYENGAYVLTFKMPAHDVKLSVNSRNTMVYIPAVAITLENRVRTADVWIMEDTSKNRKRSIWGETTIKACGTNEPQEVIIEAVSSKDLYIVRMIDERKQYYEACGVEILNGQSVVIESRDDGMSTFVCIYDGKGSLVNQYEMFVAAL